MLTNPQIKEIEWVEVETEKQNTLSLLVWNDEVNTFDFVIQSLVEICQHTYEQAEQCTLIIHFKGKYAVKHGSREELRPMRDAFVDRGIGATIEE